MQKKILIVDDEQIIRNVLERILSSSGFQTQSAENGKAALKLLETNNFDLILLDILMPEMNGIEFLHTLKQNNYDANVIVISACHEDEIVTQTKTLGAKGFIKKPFNNINLVLSAVKNVLGKG